MEPALAIVGVGAVLAAVSMTSWLLGTGHPSPALLAPVAGPPPVGVLAPARLPSDHAAGEPLARTPTPQDTYAAWAKQVEGRTGVPARALQAYAAASIRVDHEQPSCALDWTTLAAIGSVESGNAAAGGGLAASGRPRTPISGVSLDGAGHVAAVPDTDGGVLDGDTTGDRAVGPLQFLPSTWRVWRADGDGDGRRDPQDIDDAALSAARYLCASGGLTTDSGWSAAIYSYNHSAAYVQAVYQSAVTIAAYSAP